MDGVLLEVHNQKEECCTSSLAATTSRILAIELTASLRLMVGSLSSFVSNPCLTFLCSSCILFTPNQVYPLVLIHYWAILWWFHKCLPIALVELVYHWFWASTLHGVIPLLSHVVMISPVHSYIHPVQLSKRMSTPIVSMIESVWKFLPWWAMSSLTLEFENVLFHPERLIKSMDQEDRVMRRNTSRVVKHNPILQGVMSSMHGRKSGMDDWEDLPLSTILIPDTLLATRSMHHSSFHVRGEGGAVTPRVT
jgi:hypothetical protein